MKKGERAPLLNYERGPGVPLLNLRGSQVPLLNFEGVPSPGALVPLFHHAVFVYKHTETIECVKKWPTF